MQSERLLYLALLVTFTFGALTFSVLTLAYWRERQTRRLRDGGAVFPVFTLVCAAAFVMNLMLQLGAGAAGLGLTLRVVSGFVSPLMLHTVYVEEARGLRGPRAWCWVLAVFYMVGFAAAVWDGMENAGLEVAAPWDVLLDNSPALMLGLAGAMGVVLQAVSRRELKPMEVRHRAWLRVLLLLMAAAAVINVAWPGQFVGVAPDYLVLAFFCASLYYKERLAFFDVLIKRGVFFAAALAGLTLYFVTAGPLLDKVSEDWSRPWILALSLTPLWLVSPWLYRRLSAFIDRAWLRRVYSPVDAERVFVHDVQAATTEEELRALAEQSLMAIFQTPAEVRFEAIAAPESESGDLTAALQHAGRDAGHVRLHARPDSIPFMIDDRHLLQTLARTLGVVLENVRFRQERLRQEEQEQELRWLASRAELKALRAQINPHFLFNALNAIAGLIRDRPQLADETIERLAQVFRYTLRKSDSEWVTVEEEVEFVAAYLRVEQARFGARLQVSFDVEAGAGTLPIPAMSIQPLVENAIKHGVSAVEGQCAVGLRAAVRDGSLQVEVSNTGPGFPPGYSLEEVRDGYGHGLRNVSERLRGYYGGSAGLRWECDQGRTRVVLPMPAVAHRSPQGVR